MPINKNKTWQKMIQKKELEKKLKKTEQEMKEEARQLDLKKGYEKDEAYEESEE